jgi:hypothetical protein
MNVQRLKFSLIAVLLLAIPALTSAATITGSGTTRFIPKFSGASTIDNSKRYQFTDPSGNGEYIGINTTSPNGSLGIQCQNGYEIFGSDTTGGSVQFQIASHFAMHILPGVNKDGTVKDPLAYFGLGAGGTGDLFKLETKKLTVDANVGVGLGATPDTNFSTGFRLKVCGSIKTKGITTDATSWCDDVFRPGYRLMPLPELEASIRSQGHLPGVPSESEVMENGVELGTMTTTLLRKVEELTLHVIELQKQNAALQARLDAPGSR